MERKWRENKDPELTETERHWVKEKQTDPEKETQRHRETEKQRK